MSQESSYKRRLPAGFLDSSFASLATFVVGLTAVNLFGDVNRGVYSVFFTAFLFGTVLPRNLIFTPAEVTTVAYPTDERLSFVNQSLLLGLIPSLLGASSALIAAAITASYASTDVIVVLTVTSAVATVLSPMQDHVRKMFHLAALSWRAAGTSLVQLMAVLITVGIGLVVDVPIVWIPFGALIVANTLSLAFALAISRIGVHRLAPARLALRSLVEKGKWLLVQSAAPSVMGFAVSAIIVGLAGPEALGFAEAARVVGQPIIVLASGFTAVLAPRSMRAAMDRDLVTAERTSRIYLSIVAAATVGYLVVAGWDWSLNPMTVIVPSAYEVGGLVAATIIANYATAAVFLQFNELLGAHKERTLAWIAWTEGAAMLVAGLTAGVTGAFAQPLANASSSVLRWFLQRGSLRKVYGGAMRGQAVSGEAG